MSKKQQKAKPQQEPMKIVDEQTDPFLRSLQKKVRNANKKLTQISDLEKRNDLKQEQIEKINRKNQIGQEKDKYIDLIELYKETWAENEKIIRKNQLKEVEELAHAIAVHQYGFKSDNKKNTQIISNIVETVSVPSQNLTLSEKIKQISQAFIAYSNNLKLKTNISEFVEQNKDKSYPKEVEEEDFEEKEEEKIEEPAKFEEPIENGNEQKVEEKEVEVVEEEKVETLKAEPEKEEVAERVEEPEKANEQVKEEVKEGEKEEEKKTEGRRKYDGNKGERRGWKKDYKKGDKPHFKPKYQEKVKEPKEDVVEDNDSEQAASFRKDEIKKLEEEGFTVVGKPKIKARDQKQYYDKQHGRKNHHHHQKHNY